MSRAPDAVRSLVVFATAAWVAHSRAVSGSRPAARGKDKMSLASVDDRQPSTAPRGF